MTTNPADPSIRIRRTHFYVGIAYANYAQALCYRHAARLSASFGAKKAFRDEMRRWMRYHAKMAVSQVRTDRRLAA